MVSYENCMKTAQIVFIGPTLFPALSLDRIIALDVLQGCCTKEQFRNFILVQIVSLILYFINNPLY